MSFCNLLPLLAFFLRSSLIGIHYIILHYTYAPHFSDLLCTDGNLCDFSFLVIINML